jgi:hypothetical protein
VTEQVLGRYVVCRKAEDARKDAHDREAIVAALRDVLRQGAKSLVGNEGYRTQNVEDEFGMVYAKEII